MVGQFDFGSSVLFWSSVEVLILGEKVVKDAQSRLQVKIDNVLRSCLRSC